MKFRILVAGVVVTAVVFACMVVKNGTKVTYESDLVRDITRKK